MADFFQNLGTGGGPPLNRLLQNKGQYPAIGVRLIPLQTFVKAQYQYGQDIKTFIEYRFRASVVTAIADFSFSFAYPDRQQPFTSYINEGDIILLYVTVDTVEYPLATGIIDTIETQVSASGEIVSVLGRDMLGQWEDQGVFTPDGQGIWAENISPSQVFRLLQNNTRMPRMRLQGIPDSNNYIGANFMESKLSVLNRYLEPYNALVWCDPDGAMVMGKPNMAQANSGTVIMSRSQKVANCISMRSTRSAATIPNFILPIQSAQVEGLNQLSKKPGIANPQPGPKRLASLGHYLHRVNVTSLQTGNNAQIMNSVQLLKNFGGKVQDVCTAMALREMARENMRELIIQAVVPGHINENALPYRVDQCYHVVFDRDKVDQSMYLFEVEYTCNETEGPKSLLMFTQFNTIVAGNNFQ